MFSMVGHWAVRSRRGGTGAGQAHGSLAVRWDLGILGQIALQWGEDWSFWHVG